MKTSYYCTHVILYYTWLGFFCDEQRADRLRPPPLPRLCPPDFLTTAMIFLFSRYVIHKPILYFTQYRVSCPFVTMTTTTFVRVRHYHLYLSQVIN